MQAFEGGRFRANVKKGRRETWIGACVVSTFKLFILLQLADLLSTLAAFSLGGVENNPIVAQMIGHGHFAGLLMAKLIVLALGAGIAWLGRSRVIRMANFAYGGILAWNLSIIARLALAL